MFATVVVDPAVDPREPGRDLVDGAVQVVDPALERDGELDQVLAAAADQHPLRVAQPADAHPGDPGERDARDAPSDDADDGDRGGGVPGDVHAATDGSEKMTWYAAELFVLFDLARHRRHVDRDRRLRRERHLAEIAERHASGRSPGSISCDLLRLRDRPALRLRPVDRQRDGDLHLLRVAAVVDRRPGRRGSSSPSPCSASRRRQHLRPPGCRQRDARRCSCRARPVGAPSGRRSARSAGARAPCVRR